MPIDQADRDYLRRKVDLRLAKFVPSIERVSVRVVWRAFGVPAATLTRRSRAAVMAQKR
jgi:hypothetical protein